MTGPWRTDAIPSVPDAIAVQRVRYVSPNLLAGDTSFELPAGNRPVISRQGASLTERVGPIPCGSKRVNTLAVHGRRALRLFPVPGGGGCAIHWRGVRLEPKRVYTFSAYVRGVAGSTTIRLVPGWPMDRWRTEAFQITDQWQRCQVSFETRGDEGEQASLTCTPALLVSASAPQNSGAAGHPAWLEVDAVQLEAGATASRYRPQPAVECAAAAEPWLASVAHAGRPIRIDCTVRNNTAEYVRLQLVWQLSDVLDPRPHLRVLDLELPPGHGHDVKLDFGVDGVGYYVLRTDVRGGVDVGLLDRVGLAVVDASAVGHGGAESFLGLAAADVAMDSKRTRSPTSQPTVAALGTLSPQRVVWRWRDLETAPGEDDFTAANGVIEAMAAARVEPVVCLAGPTADLAPAWAVRVDGGVRRVDRRQYRQFVFRVAGHFRNRVRFWHLPPAPDGQWVAWARLFRQAAKLASPRASVVGPGFAPSGGSGPAEISAFIAAGGAGEVDVLLHRLCAPEKAGLRGDWDRLDRDLADVAKACAAAGRADLPRWEVTPAWCWPDRDGPADRAIRIHRTALLLKKHRVSCWLVPPPPASNGETSRDCPVEVVTCATLARRFASAEFRRQQPVGQDLVAMLFDAAEGPFAALIHTSPSSSAAPVAISIPAGLRAENLFGRVLADGSASTDLTLSSAPIYVRPVDGRADWSDLLRFETQARALPAMPSSSGHRALSMQ